MTKLQHIVPCLWFDDQAENAALHYISIFGAGSRITQISRYTEAGREFHGHEPGSVMTVEFVLGELPFTALNGGPTFRFNQAISLQVMCDTQEEIDHYWDALSNGGDPEVQQCGWLEDRYGVSWQIVPRKWVELASSSDTARVTRMTQALFAMKKPDLAELERAFAG